MIVDKKKERKFLRKIPNIKENIPLNIKIDPKELSFNKMNFIILMIIIIIIIIQISGIMEISKWFLIIHLKITLQIIMIIISI
jgi:hypothetical protein